MKHTLRRRLLPAALSFALGLALAGLPVMLAAMLDGAQAAPGVSPGFQFPTTPWQSYAPARVQCGKLAGANFNSASADQAIPISAPSALYMLDAITINNASLSLTTAAGGFYTAAAQGGVALVAATQAYSTLTSAANDAAGSAMSATIATAGATNALDLPVIYFNLTTAQGAAATADIRAFCRPLY